MLFVSCGQQQQAKSVVKDFVAQQLKKEVSYLEFSDVDSTRAISPLRQAEDAIVLDNSNMTIPEQNAWLVEQYRRAAAE